MTTAIFLNGVFLDDPAGATISLWDRGYLLGDGAFETMRAYDGVAFRAQAHLSRLSRGSATLGIPLPLSLEALETVVQEALRRSTLSSAYVRVTLTRGPGPGGVGTAGCGPSTLSVIVRELRTISRDAYLHGIDSKILATRRVPPACLDSSIKTTNYLTQIVAKRELEPAGMQEGVQLAVDGQVVGGTVSNLFLVRAGTLWTPGLESGCLPGVTRAAVVEVARQCGVAVRETRIEPADLATADEVFFASTLLELLPVRHIDGVGAYPLPARVTELLDARFHELVARETGAGAS